MTTETITIKVAELIPVRKIKAITKVWDSPQNCHVVRKPRINGTEKKS